MMSAPQDTRHSVSFVFALTSVIAWIDLPVEFFLPCPFFGADPFPEASCSNNRHLAEREKKGLMERA